MVRWAVLRRWERLFVGVLVGRASGLAAVEGWRGRRHVCEACGCGFDKRKQWDAHVAGRRHAEAGRAADAAERAFLASPWADAAPACVGAVRRPFDVGDFLAAVPRRSDKGASMTCSPRVVVDDLDGPLRAALYRYLHDAPGGVADAVAAACLASPRHARVKELLESVEVVKVVVRRFSRGDRPSTIFDLAAGHGFVAHLLAAAFAATSAVVAVDLLRRDAFDAWRAAFVARGHPGATFREANLADVRLDADSLVVVVHGCDDANAVALDLARAARAHWVVVPCCLKANLYLANARAGKQKSNRSPVAPLDDDTRYVLLCGALAAKYDADLYTCIDRRITGRHLVIGGRGAAADAPAAATPAAHRMPTFRGPHVPGQFADG